MDNKVTGFTTEMGVITIAGPEPKRQGGGTSSSMLNTLAGPSPVLELQQLKAEREQLIKKLISITGDIAMLDLHLHLANNELDESAELAK